MYQTIIQNNTYEVIEKKSKFIANLFYVESKEDAELKIQELKKKYYDARHNCFAYRILEDNDFIYEKSSDNGEPPGTAGGPMLNILKKNNLCNILVIVTRYFGGILLGTGGLVRCYSASTQGVVEKSNKIIIEPGTEFEIYVDYNNFQNLKYYFQKNNIIIKNVEYLDNIKCKIEMNDNTKIEFLKDIKNKKKLIIKIEEIGKKYVIKEN